MPSPRRSTACMPASRPTSGRTPSLHAGAVGPGLASPKAVGETVAFPWFVSMRPEERGRCAACPLMRCL